VHPLGPLRGVFGMSFRILWPFSAAIALLLVPLVMKSIVTMKEWSWLAAIAAVASLALVPLLVFALAAPIAWLYRLRVHELGLRGFDVWGRFRSVRWPEMTDATPLDLLTLPYLRVHTTDAGVELTIPLFLADRAGFARLVTECAGPENPLARYLAYTDAAP
jgi:hypothetical protein